MMRCRFPFNEGFSTDSKQVEHADGSFTENAFTPFCFSKHQLHKFQEMQSTQVNMIDIPDCLAIHEDMSDESENVLLSQILAKLERDGFAVLKDISKISLLSDLFKHVFNNQRHVISYEESHPILSSSIVMSLCDGIIGHQVLSVDQKQGLEGLVFPPSIFTDGEDITTIPWELQAAEYKLDCHSSNGYLRSTDYGIPGFKLRTKLDEVLEVVWAMEDAPLEANDSSIDSIRLIRGSHRWSKLQDRSLGLTLAAGADTADMFEWRGERGEVLVFLSNTFHKYTPPPPSTHGRLLWTSYHAAYLRQRTNMYTICPPNQAVALPPYMQRLIGYSMPGPVLNKLYCGSGDAEILKAYTNYGDRAIDWVGAACKQEGADACAALCESNALATDCSNIRDLNLENIAVWIERLPHRDLGLVTIDNSAPEAFPLLLAAMVRDGCAVIKDAVSSSLCDTVMSQLQPYSEHVQGASVGCIPARSSAAWPIASHPLVLQLCESILGRQSLRMTSRQLSGVLSTSHDSYSYHIHICLTIPKQAGGAAQSLHRDGDLSLLDMPTQAGVDHAISTIWALDGDFTEERGTTRVVLGSHDWPPARQVSPSESIPAVMTRGSVLIYTGRTVHGAGHNQSPSPRIALNVGYNSACLKQEENQYVSVPPSIAQTLPKAMQKLLGY
jgi:ectoine hydroxylase-related dioxygenase (phytanoyl-CoA dioxygenase family)